MSIDHETALLVRIREKIERALRRKEVATADFVEICQAFMPVFDSLGTVFSFAKKEFLVKNMSLHEASGKFRTLREVVDHDKELGMVSIKNSCARNLHRLGSALTFVFTLMRELTSSLSMQLKDAANSAYLVALAPIHTKLVKSIVIAGLMALPTRATFLDNIHESGKAFVASTGFMRGCDAEESAKERTRELLPLVEQLTIYIESLYDEPMPISNTWFISY